MDERIFDDIAKKLEDLKVDLNLAFYDNIRTTLEGLKPTILQKMEAIRRCYRDDSEILERLLEFERGKLIRCYDASTGRRHEFHGPNGLIRKCGKNDALFDDHTFRYMIEVYLTFIATGDHDDADHVLDYQLKKHKTWAVESKNHFE